MQTNILKKDTQFIKYVTFQTVTQEQAPYMFVISLL